MRTAIFVLLVLLSAPAAAAPELDLVLIPAGTAQLGDAEGHPTETVRTARISAFKIMRREVTNAQFAEFVTATGYVTTPEKSRRSNVWTDKWRLVASAVWRMPQGPTSSVETLDDHPVVQVSAIDAKAFCVHYGLRLPTGDEWEYAARGSDGRRYPWGNELTPQSLPKLVNAGTWRCCQASDADGHLRTAPVGSFPTSNSPFGLQDMIGNVWEWTSSPYPVEPDKLAIRGGGWGNNPYCLRAAYRHGNFANVGLDMVGFRCAADMK